MTVALNPIHELEADHRQVRDILLDLVDAGNRGDGTKALELLLTLDKLGGPHFRFEEESLYPALVKFFGPEYYEYLLGDADFTFTSDYKTFKQIYVGQINPATAFINRDVKVEPMARLYRNPAFSARSISTGNHMVRILREVQTVFSLYGPL